MKTFWFLVLEAKGDHFNTWSFLGFCNRILRGGGDSPNLP